MKGEHNMACGLHLCGMCAKITLVFGILFLIAGFGWWGGAPGWFNGWTLIGLYLGLLGLGPWMMKSM